MPMSFISMRSHCETIAAKDETIAVLRETVQNLTQSLKALESLAESLKPRMPMLRPRREADTERKPQKVDYANLDPDDNVALGAAARLELGPGKHKAQDVIRRMEHIKRQILLNRDAQMLRAVAPPPPAAVSELIEKTIQDGIAAGTTGEP